MNCHTIWLFTKNIGYYAWCEPSPSTLIGTDRYSTLWCYYLWWDDLGQEKVREIKEVCSTVLLAYALKAKVGLPLILETKKLSPERGNRILKLLRQNCKQICHIILKTEILYHRQMSLIRRTICFTWRHLILTRMQMCISKRHICLREDFRGNY